jgi:hypothetical protein
LSWSATTHHEVSSITGRHRGPAPGNTHHPEIVKISLGPTHFAVVFGLLSARRLSAQLSVRASADAALANASVIGGEYIEGERGKLVLAGGAYIDVGRRGVPVRLVLGATAERYRDGDKVNAICIPGSRGQCLTRAPDLGGLVGLVGLRYDPLSRVSALAAYGHGRVGRASVSGDAPTKVGADEFRIEGRVWPAAHLAVGVRFQSITIPNYAGVRLTAKPVSFVVAVR